LESLGVVVLSILAFNFFYYGHKSE
jgi:hypothetical protein